MVVQRSRKKELEQLRRESRERESPRSQLGRSGSWKRSARGYRRGTPSCSRKRWRCSLLARTGRDVRRAEGAEATLRSERAAFEEAKECLEDDLSRALIAQDEAEKREQAVIEQCQREIKVFKFEKYKDGY